MKTLQEEIERVVEEFIKDFRKQRFYDFWHNERAEDYLRDWLRQTLTHQVERAVKETGEKMLMKGDAGKLAPFQETVNTYIKNRTEEILNSLNNTPH